MIQQDSWIKGKVEPDVQAQCSVGPLGLNRSMVQSNPGAALALQQRAGLVWPLEPALLEEEEVGAFAQSLWSLWPILTLCGDMLFSRSLWMLRHCLLRVVSSLFWNNWNTQVGASVIVNHHLIYLAELRSDKCCYVSVMHRLKCWPSFSSVECSLCSILETQMLKYFLSKA